MHQKTEVRILDLFSGVGGFSLAARMAGGYETVAFCEKDPFCQKVLAKHWPGVPIHDDIHEFTGDAIRRLGRIDIVTGGFPCPPFSSASRGRRRDELDHRWLWPQMLRVIHECKPAWVLCENVTGLDSMALEQVLADLETESYEVAPPFEIPACAVDADHIRQRLWILGYAYSDSESGVPLNGEAPRLSGNRGNAGSVGTTDGLSGRLDAHRLKALGNAIVPQVAAVILDAIRQAYVERLTR